MKVAATGVRMHSGWGALVAVSNDGGKLSVVDRRRIDVIDEKSPQERNNRTIHSE